MRANCCAKLKIRITGDTCLPARSVGCLCPRPSSVEQMMSEQECLPEVSGVCVRDHHLSGTDDERTGKSRACPGHRHPTLLPAEAFILVADHHAPVARFPMGPVI